MKFGLQWMREYVNISMTTEMLAERLSLIGLAVDGVTQPPSLPGVVVGLVQTVEKHPNADKLSLTRVDIGNEILSIVCGASNVRPGQWVPVATVGTIMPGGFEIKKAKIRGQESHGMICSRSELGYEKEKSPGIWELDDRGPQVKGMALSEFLGDDTVFDLDITSNRPDLLSMIGLAREIACLEPQKIRVPDVRMREGGAKTSEAIAVQIDDSAGCRRYAARIVRGMKIGPSPTWLSRRLESIGLRSINNIVDITNYVMLECGQPLHAFDYDQIAGGRIVVRSARNGEEFVTLDGRSHKLTGDAVVICDGDRAVALGGVMGGQNSEISDTTTNVLLEAAWFHPTRIRRTAKQLGMATDASQRFERGVDPCNTVWALDRAAQLIGEIAGGEILSGAIDVLAQPEESVQIRLTSDDVQRLLGMRLSTEDIRLYLERQSCHVHEEGKDVFLVQPPSFRRDLQIKEDLIEDIARLHGYDQFPDAVSAVIPYDAEPSAEASVQERLRALFRECGIDEAYTNSMTSEKEQRWIRPEAACVPLKNPLNDDMGVMRSSMLPGLLHILRGNLFRQNPDVRVYEIGRTFVRSEEDLPVETTWASACLTGAAEPVHWSRKPQGVDFFDVKSLFQQIATKFHLDSVNFSNYDNSSIFTVAQEVIVKKNGQVAGLGYFGSLSRSVLRKFDIDADVLALEVDLRVLMGVASDQPAFREVGRFPFIRRDLALILNDSTPAQRVLEFVRSESGPLLAHVEIFDRYTEKPLGAGEHSLAFSLTFRASDRTLTEAEVDDIMARLIDTTGREFGARLRT